MKQGTAAPHALLLGPESWRNGLARSLAEAGIDSVGVSDVTEGAGSLGGVDVVFCLVDEGDPLQAISTLWWVSPNLPAILCGDDPDPDLANAAREAGIAVVIPAIPGPIRLAALVDVVVAGKRNASERPLALAHAMATLCEMAVEIDRHLVDIVGVVADLFNADVVSILLVNPSGALHIAANVGLPGSVGSICPPGLGLHVFTSGSARLLLGDARKKVGVPTNKRSDVTASMLAPFRGGKGQHMRGVLTVGKQRSHSIFTPRDLEVCIAIATLIGELLAGAEVAREARTMQDRLNAAARLTTLGELAAGVVHDVANPLSAVRVNLETLIAHLAELRPVLDSLEAENDKLSFVLEDLPSLLCETYEGVLRANDVVRQMKQVVRLGSTGQGEAVDVAAAVESAIRMLRSRVHTPVVMVAEDRCRIRGVPVDLLQVLTNLISNASDACNERHRTEALAGLPYQPEISVTLRHEGAHSVVRIRDNGTGMSEEVLRRMWEQLFTTKPAGQGTGLGMPIVLRIVNEHAGTIEVSSTLGVGTEFRLAFPLHLEIEEQAAPLL